MIRLLCTVCKDYFLCNHYDETINLTICQKCIKNNISYTQNNLYKYSYLLSSLFLRDTDLKNQKYVKYNIKYYLKSNIDALIKNSPELQNKINRRKNRYIKKREDLNKKKEEITTLMKNNKGIKPDSTILYDYHKNKIDLDTVSNHILLTTANIELKKSQFMDFIAENQLCFDLNMTSYIDFITLQNKSINKQLVEIESLLIESNTNYINYLKKGLDQGYAQSLAFSEYINNKNDCYLNTLGQIEKDKITVSF